MSGPAVMGCKFRISKGRSIIPSTDFSEPTYLVEVRTRQVDDTHKPYGAVGTKSFSVPRSRLLGDGAMAAVEDILSSSGVPPYIRQPMIGNVSSFVKEVESRFANTDGGEGVVYVVHLVMDIALVTLEAVCAQIEAAPIVAGRKRKFSCYN